jgi:hypothetical protein
MISLEPLSFIISVLELVKLGNNLNHAEDEVKHVCEQLDETNELLTRVRRDLDRFAPLLNQEYIQRIEAKCDRTELALRDAKRFAESHLKKTSSERPFKNLKWVLGDQGTALIHLATVSQYANELQSAIPTALWCDPNPSFYLPWIRQMSNNTARIECLGWSIPHLLLCF